MQKPESGLGFLGQALPIVAHRLQQAHGAHHVGLNEVFGAVDGAVDMAFCRKVEHRSGLVLRQQTRHQLGVANVALHKHMARVVGQSRQVFQIARVG